ncbi:unnamed protein product [Chrysoparadoxa australica]
MLNAVILATAGFDHKIRFWEPPSGACSRTVRYADSQVNCLRITPDKQYLAAAGNPHVRLFEVSVPNPNAVVAYDGHTSNVSDLGFQKDGKWMYTGSEDGTIKIWDVRAPVCQRNYENKAKVHSVALHPNQAELISGDQLGKVKVWDLTASKCRDVAVDSQDNSIQSITVATDASYVVAASSKGRVFVLNPGPANYKLTKQFQAHEGYLLKTVLSPNVAHLVTTGSDKSAKVWEVGNDWKLLHTLQQHQRWVWDAVFSADSSYLVTASSDHTAKLWEVSSGEVLRNYIGHGNSLTCVALNDSK